MSVAVWESGVGDVLMISQDAPNRDKLGMKCLSGRCYYFVPCLSKPMNHSGTRIMHRGDWEKNTRNKKRKIIKITQHVQSKEVFQVISGHADFDKKK